MSKETIAKLTATLEMVTKQLDAIAQGFEYPPEVLLAKVEKAQAVLSEVNAEDAPITPLAGVSGCLSFGV